MARPRSKRKADPLFGDGSKKEKQWDTALRPFDRLGNEMDQKWGFDRLVELQDAETAARWGEVLGALSDAQRGDDTQELLTAVATAMKGLEVMDAQATAAGHTPPGTDAVLCELPAESGEPPFKIAIARTAAEACAVSDAMPEYRAFTAREAAIALRAYTSTRLFDAVKESFPKSEITSITPKPFQGEDPIPFGNDAT